MKKRVKYNYQYIRQFIETNSKCLLLTLEDEYVSTKEKLQIQCDCGNIFWASFYQFNSQNKRSCNECSKIRQRNLFKEDIESIINYINNPETGNGCCYIEGEYTNNQSLLKIRCACGNIFETIFASFKFTNKKQCNVCGRKKTSNSLKIKCEDVVKLIRKNGDELLTPENEYDDSTTMLKILCKCGEIFECTFHYYKHHLKGNCNTCRKEKYLKRRITPYEKIKKFVEIESNSGCKLLTLKNEYINTRVKMKLECKCGNIFYTDFHEFKSGNKRKCNECSINLIKTSDFIDMFKDSDKVNGCKLIYCDNNEYITARSVIKLECACGEIFETERFLFTNRNKNKCDKCSSALSKGEDRIRSYLIQNNIPHVREYYFDDCRGLKKPLPFDFAVFDMQSNLIYLIEYDGKQHFEPVNFGGCSDETALLEHEYLKKNDQIKNNYCKQNNIPLLRIPYWDFDNIVEILSKTLLSKLMTHYIAS